VAGYDPIRIAALVQALRSQPQPANQVSSDSELGYPQADIPAFPFGENGGRGTAYLGADMQDPSAPVHLEPSIVKSRTAPPRVKAQP
jgi:hypothetical protein